MTAHKEWFKAYTADIRKKVSDSVIEMVDLKIAHTFRVKNHSIKIAEGIGLNEKETNLAGLIGLYHDLGRFSQAIDFATMNDRITGSHADMSVDVFINHAPKDGLTKEDIQVITKALEYHNLLTIPETDDYTALSAKLIRDADKLDILDIFSNWEENQKFLYLSDKNDPCTKELLDFVLSGKNFNSNLVKNKNDCRLLYISMIFDLNFTPSFKWLWNNDILAKLTEVETDKPNEDMKKVFDYVSNWINNKMLSY